MLYIIYYILYERILVIDIIIVVICINGFNYGGIGGVVI